MMDLHFLEDGGTVIGDDDFTVWTDEHLVHSLWSKRCLKETGDSSRGHNVDLVGFHTLDSLLLGLFSQDNERSA